MNCRKNSILCLKNVKNMLKYLMKALVIWQKKLCLGFVYVKEA